MKKLYSPFALRTAFVVLLMLSFVRGWGQSPATYNFIATSGSVDTNISFSTAAKSAATPAIVSGALRLYSFRTTGDGNELILTPQNGAIITAVSIVRAGTSGTPSSVTYSVNGGAFVNFPNSITGISANTSFTIKNQHQGGATNIQLHLSSITVTYSLPASGKTVTFNGNGSTSGSMVNQTASTATNLTANSFTRTGYTFTNWHTTTSGTGGTTYTNGQNYDFSADLTLYAQWTIDSYNVIYDLNGGTGTTPTTQNGNYNTNLTLASGAGFSRAGYTFNGWNTAINGSGTAYASGATYTVPASTQTLYAQWVSTAPFITTSGTLSALSTTYGTASGTTSFTVSAGNLTNDLIITPPSGFMVSESAGSGFTNSLNLTAANQTNKQIFVRLEATTPAGTYSGNITLASTGVTTVNVATASSTVNKKGVTITGLTPTPSKEYDGTTTVTVTSSPTYVGLVNSESFSVTGTVSWAYPDANVGTNKTLTRTGNYDAPSGNYTVTQPSLTASITAKPLTISAPTIASKVYNTSATTGAITPGTLSGLVGTQTLTVTASGTYADADAAIGKTATVVYLLGNGTGIATNYSLANGTGTGDITKATPTYTPTTISVTVGATQTIPASVSDSPGTLTFVSNNTGTATVNSTTGAVTGVTVGSTTIDITQAESTNYIGGSTSVTVNVSTITYLTNDYRTTGTGNWVSNNASPAIWERLDSGGVWNISNSPNYNTTNNVYIREGHVITATGSFSNGVKLKVMQGGVFQMNSSGAAASVYVYTGGEMRVNGALTVVGTFDVEDNANVYLNADIANPGTTIWLGSENFRPLSNFYIRNWRTSQYLYNNNITANNSGTIFGNLYIDTSGGVTGSWNLLGPSTGTINLTNGDLVFNSAQGNVRFFAETGSTANVTVKGDLKLNSTWASARILALSTAGVINLTVDGNVDIDSPGDLAIKQAISAASAATLNIKGDLLMNGVNTTSDTNLHLNATNAASGGGKAIINLQGDLLVGSNATIVNSVGTSDVEFNFTGSSIQTVNVGSSVSGSNTDNSRGIPFYTKSNAFVELKNDLTLSNGSRFTVENNGTLDFGFTGLTPHIIKQGSSGNSAFVSQAGSVLRITSPLGLSTTGNIGNVQVTATAATRDFSSIGTFHYIGKANQVTGNALSTSSEKNVIVEMNADNLQLTPSATFGITNTGVLDIRKGKVVETETEYVTGSTGTLKMAPATYYKITKASPTTSEYIPRLDNVILTGGEIELASTGNQTLRGGKTYYDLTFSGGATKEVSTGTSDVNGIISILANTTLDGKTFTVGKATTELFMDSGSLFKTGGNGAKPDAGGDYVLDPTSTIEFQDASATNIRVTPTYENIIVSGNNVKSGGQILTVNNLTKVVGTGKLTIPETADSEIPNVLFARKGIQVDDTAIALFANNANLLQDAIVVNLGKINSERKASMKRGNYTYWSSPVNGQNLKTFSPGTLDTRFYTYDESDDMFDVIDPLTNDFADNGKGYSIRASNNYTGTTNTYVFTGKFEGTPNNGEKTIAVTKTASGNNLIGNPYPSNIDFRDLVTDNPAVFNGGAEAVAYFWTNLNPNPAMQGTGYPGTGYFNNYATLNMSGGVPATLVVDPDDSSQNSNGETPTYYIKPGQGFIIKVAASGDLTFRNNMRKVGDGSVFFNNNKRAEEQTDRFWISLKSPMGAVTTQLIAYLPNATNGFDGQGYDAKIGTLGADAFYSKIENDKFAIQGRGAFAITDQVDLGTSHYEAGIHSIALGKKEGVFANGHQHIYLKDKHANTITDLTAGDYVFNAVAGNTEDRFEIVYENDLVLGTDNQVRKNLIIYRNGDEFIIKSNDDKITEVELYDSVGRLLITVKPNATEARINVSHLSNAFYVLKIDQNGKVSSKKVIK